MATEIEDLEGAEVEGGAQPAEGGRKKKLIIIIAALLVLGGAGIGAFSVFGGKHDAEKPKAAQQLPPHYITLDPPFVVNFEAESVVRFLQVTVGVMTREPAVEQIVKDNDPRVRNDLLMILSNQTYTTVSSLEGKEALRQRCLDSVRTIVTEMGGDAQKVEALYFTSFVMQ